MREKGQMVGKVQGVMGMVVRCAVDGGRAVRVRAEEVLELGDDRGRMPQMRLERGGGEMEGVMRCSFLLGTQGWKRQTQ